MSLYARLFPANTLKSPSQTQAIHSGFILRLHNRVIALAWCAVLRTRSFRLLIAVLAGISAHAGGAASGALAAKPAAGRPLVHLAADGHGALADAGNPEGHFYVPPAGQAVSTSHPNHVIGDGTPANCTSAAVVRAVAAGGIITFNCGSKPVTILMKRTAWVPNTSSRVVLDGGGLVTLSGGGERRILFSDTCAGKWSTENCVSEPNPRSWYRTSRSKTATAARTRRPARPTARNAGTAASMAAAPYTSRAASSRRSTRGSSATSATATAPIWAAAPSACSRNTTTSRCTSLATRSPAAVALMAAP